MTRDSTVADSIIDVIGATPCVSLGRLVAARGVSGRLIAKLEYLNPGFSKKDRVALEIVREARADGRLADGNRSSSSPAATPAPGSPSSAEHSVIRSSR